MAYTTNNLIADAYYSAGIVSREFETVSGTQYSDGLRMLNDIIQDKDVNQGMIPYETQYNFFVQPGVEKYCIPDLIQIDTLVFYLNDVRFAMNYSKRNQYFGTPRVENIQSLPYHWYFERGVGGGNLYIYFKPDRAYPMEVHGTFRLPLLTLGQDLETNQTIVNLGKPTYYSSSANLSQGELVVNDFDLQGTYYDIGSIVNYINTGIIENVRAEVNAFGELILTNNFNCPIAINVRTAGYPPNGTKFIRTLIASSTVNLDATYNNGNLGIASILVGNNNGALVLDGVSVIADNYVLIKDQTDPIENGVYRVSDPGSVSTPFILRRWDNYWQPIEIGIGDLFEIQFGNTLSDSTFIQTSNVSEVGLSPISFELLATLTFANFSTVELPNYKIYAPLGLDRFYISYLRFALADRLCTEFNYQVPDGVRRQLSEYEAMIEKKSRLIDLRMQKVSTLNKESYVNWAFVNLGRGFRVP